MKSDTAGIRVLCPTRWTVRVYALKSILDNYSVLQDLWDVALDEAKDTESKARIHGISCRMTTFDYTTSALYSVKWS